MPTKSPSPAVDTPYTVADVCALTGYSARTIIRMFGAERGVIVINRPTTNRKRRYRTIRIPRFVYDRVIRGLTVR